MCHCNKKAIEVGYLIFALRDKGSFDLDLLRKLRWKELGPCPWKLCFTPLIKCFWYISDRVTFSENLKCSKGMQIYFDGNLQ